VFLAKNGIRLWCFWLGELEILLLHPHGFTLKWYMFEMGTAEVKYISHQWFGLFLPVFRILSYLTHVPGSIWFGGSFPLQ